MRLAWTCSSECLLTRALDSSNVLDALIRTVLSCNTSSRNSTAAHKAMVEAYGKNNFQALLDAPHAELAATIRCGGLHDRKAGIIQGVSSTWLQSGPDAAANVRLVF